MIPVTTVATVPTHDDKGDEAHTQSVLCFWSTIIHHLLTLGQFVKVSNIANAYNHKTYIMAGTNSNNTIVHTDLLKKSIFNVAKTNTAGAPSVPSAKEIMDPNNITLVTLDGLKKKSMKNKRCPVDLDNPVFYDTKDNHEKVKEENNKKGGGEGKKLSWQRRFYEEFNDDSVPSKDSDDSPNLRHCCEAFYRRRSINYSSANLLGEKTGIGPSPITAKKLDKTLSDPCPITLVFLFKPTSFKARFWRNWDAAKCKQRALSSIFLQKPQQHVNNAHCCKKEDHVQDGQETEEVSISQVGKESKGDNAGEEEEQSNINSQ